MLMSIKRMFIASHVANINTAEVPLAKLKAFEDPQILAKGNPRNKRLQSYVVESPSVEPKQYLTVKPPVSCRGHL